MLRRLGSLLVELRATAECPVPTELRIFAAGANDSEKGTFTFDDKAAKAVMANLSKRGVELPFDYNHGSTSLFGMLNPEMSGKAAGWFKAELRAGELWATSIRWTEPAQKAIEAKEWRYISPTFATDDKGKRVTKMLAVALTNTPALHNLPPLIAASLAADAAEGEPHMEQIVVALGLKAGASEAEVLAAIVALGVTAGTQKAAVAELSQKVATLEAAAQTVELNALITKGLADRKITPATEKALRGIGAVALKAFLDAAPAVVDPKATTEKEGAADTQPAVELTAGEKAHCKKFQIDAAKYLAHKQKLAAAEAESA